MSNRVFLSFLFFSAVASSQWRMTAAQGGPPLPLPSDVTILEAGDTRDDLSCGVRPVAPQIGFDLNFHAGYEASLPLKELVGSGNLLTAVFRVSPEGHPEKLTYFVQNWSVPALTEAAKGRIDFGGSFLLGEGKYQIEWMLRDRNERVCSTRWAATAEPRAKEKQIPLAMAPGTVQPDTADPFGVEADEKRPDGAPLKVLVLFHAARPASGVDASRQMETSALLSILRRIAREPRIGAYCLIAFNLDQATILYRGHDMPQVDFPALGEALKRFQPGRIDIQQLRERESAGEFLTRIVQEEVAHSRPNAVIFVGQRTPDTAPVSRSSKYFGPLGPLFNLSYVADPISNPFRDTISNLVKAWKGTEYPITRPSDLSSAWTEVMSRISAKKTINLDSSPAVTSLTPKRR